MIITSLDFDFLKCKARVAIITDFIRLSWGLNELIKILGPWNLFFSSITAPFVILSNFLAENAT